MLCLFVYGLVRLALLLKRWRKRRRRSVGVRCSYRPSSLKTIQTRGREWRGGKKRLLCLTCPEKKKRLREHHERDLEGKKKNNKASPLDVLRKPPYIIT